MREKVSAEAIERFMKAVGRAGRASARIYCVGGVSAVLLGWRETTIDIDLKLVPEVNEHSAGPLSSLCKAFEG